MVGSIVRVAPTPRRSQVGAQSITQVCHGLVSVSAYAIPQIACGWPTATLGNTCNRIASLPIPEMTNS